MKESCICNAKVAKIGGHYYLNLRGPGGNNVSTKISRHQGTKLLTELDLTIKDYDSEFTSDGQNRSKHQENRDDADI